MNTLRSTVIGAAGCAVGVVAFLFATGYAGDVQVSRRVDSGPPALLVAALTIDLLLLGLCVLTLWPRSPRRSGSTRPSVLPSRLNHRERDPDPIEGPAGHRESAAQNRTQALRRREPITAE